MSMRGNTRTTNIVFHDFGIATDRVPPNDPALTIELDDVSVCQRCRKLIFSPASWAHLRGDTIDCPPIPTKDGDSSDWHIQHRPDHVDEPFFFQQFNVGGNLPHRRGPMLNFPVPLSEIVQSSRDSCSFCKLLVVLNDNDASLVSKDSQKRMIRLQAIWPSRVSGGYCPMMLEVGLHADQSGGGNAWPLVFFDESTLAANQPRSSIEDLWAQLKQIKVSLQACEDGHAECSSVEIQNPPTRLLDLLFSEDIDEVHLVNSTDLSGCRYVALSYIWGAATGQPGLKNPASDSSETALALDDLQPTIQNAVDVTRFLGLRYLWVDRFCIDQASATDKEREIPRMRDYYRNAVVVISASGASGADEQFLRETRTGDEIHAELLNPAPRRQALTGATPFRIPMHVAQGPPKSLLVDLLPSFDNYGREPINRRAWTFQETILPRRLLSFPMTGGMILRCQKTEFLAGEIVSDPFHETPGFFSNESSDASFEQLQKADKVFAQWIEMVEDYTQRSITHRSDVLIAIGALARDYQTKHERTLGTYIGGLWEKVLLPGLLWHAIRRQQDEEGDHEQQTQYFAPSWSWASCPHAVSFRNEPEIYFPLGPASEAEEEFYRTRWYSEIISVEVTPTSSLDHFGALKAGVLVVRGPLRQAYFDVKSRKPSKDRGGSAKKTISKSWRKLPHKLGNAFRHRSSHDRRKADLEDKDDDEEQKKENEEYTLYLETDESWGGAEGLIFDRRRDSPAEYRNSGQTYYWLALWHAGRGRARGLILQKEEGEQNTFSRVGFAVFPLSNTEYLEADLPGEPVIRLI